MNAEFKTEAGTTVKVSTHRFGSEEDEVQLVGGVVRLTTVFDPDTMLQLQLKRSEARAIASALMGAAAEL